MEGSSCVRWRGGDSVGANVAPGCRLAGYRPTGSGWVPGSRTHSSRAWESGAADRRGIRLWPGRASPAIQASWFRSPRRQTDRSHGFDAVAGLGLAQPPWRRRRDSAHLPLPEASRVTALLAPAPMSRSPRYQGTPFKSGACANCFGRPPATCISAMTSTPANPPARNAAITHQIESIWLPRFHGQELVHLPDAIDTRP